MEKKELRGAVLRYLARAYRCDAAELEEERLLFTLEATCREPCLKMMAFERCVVVLSSAPLADRVKELLSGRSRDEIFECPFVYGQTIHYVPDLSRLSESDLPDAYAPELLVGAEVYRMRGIRGFENALAFDKEGFTPTVIACLARSGGEVVAVAGAAREAEDVWEVGVDVRADHRRGGLGVSLVRRLTAEIVRRGVAPVYSASVTNIASQRVALRSGYAPCWVDTYGNTLADGAPYPEITGRLRL